MPNYCSNSIVFFSKDKTKLSVFLRKVYAAYDSRKSGFYSLMVLHGYNNREIASVIDKRDDFTSCDTSLKMGKDSDTYHFSLETETAWTPHMEAFRKILHEKYSDTIQMVYISEECGCEVYINTDTEGMYLPERFVVDCCHYGVFHKEYFDTFENALEWIREEYTDLGFSRYDSVAEITDKINAANLQDEGDFFTFHHFEQGDSIAGERMVA